MNEFSVPMFQLRVSMRLTDGRTLAGDVFLPAHSPVRDGPMLAGEWANLAPAFIPVRQSSGEGVVMIAHRHVVDIALPPGVAAVASDTLVDAPVRRVSVETAGGPALTGRLAIALPAPRQRVGDWLNNSEAYLTLEVDGSVHLIRKAHIVAVTELDGE